jgi:D-alanyl-lipoteichoic acid acyltransferase DltB (MBOAT superfamily)
MRFTELDYALFLAVVWLVSRALRGRRTLWLLWLTLSSLAFYAVGEPRFLVLLLFSTVLDYVVGRALEAEDRPAIRKRWLWVSLVLNLGLLGLFKYGDFLLSLAERLGQSAGLPGFILPRLGFALPIGISFYTFQTLASTIDVYRGAPAPKRLLDFTFFTAFFPQLVAGPIVRSSELVPQIDAPARPRADAIGEGLVLIAIGLVKKLILGDGIAAALVDPFFAAPHNARLHEALVADWAAYFSLYCDFSGYTDIAIGSALLFGIVLPVNFDRPAFAASPAEHWRRWHMTLGSWLRDYLYLPLGGGRGGAWQRWRNLFLVFFVSGIWHGVGESYVLMGLYNGVLAATWRHLRPQAAGGWLGLGERLLAFQLTALSVLALRPISLDDLGAALGAFGRLSGPGIGPPDPYGLLLLFGVIALHLSPRRYKEGLLAWGRVAPAADLALLLLGVGGLCAVLSPGARDFYYFQF